MFPAKSPNSKTETKNIRNERNSSADWIKLALKGLLIVFVVLLILSPVVLPIFRVRNELRLRDRERDYSNDDASDAEIALLNSDGQVIVRQFATRVPHGSTDLAIPEGAVAYYPFENGAADASGNNNHGLLNGPISCPGVYNSTAYRFGGNDYIIAPNLGRTNVMNLTLSAWVKLARSGSHQHFIMDMRGDGALVPGCGLTIYELAGGIHQISHLCAWGSSYSSFGGIVGDISNQWHHTALVRQEITMEAYLDGRLISDTPISGIFPQNIPLIWQNNWRIGQQCCGAGFYLIGDLDEVLVYDRALSDREIQVLAADVNRGLVLHCPFDGNPYDVSAARNNVTLHGAELAPDMSGNQDAAYHFNNGDYIEVPNTNAIFDLTQWSVHAWVRLAASPNITEYRIISKHAETETRGDAFALTCTSQDNVFKCGTGLTRASDGLEFAASSNSTVVPIPPDVWHQIAGTYDGNELRLYVNCTLESSRNIGPIVTNTGPAPLRIGDIRPGNYSTYAGLRAMFGSVDKVRVYNRPLTEVEICVLYKADTSTTTTPTTSPTIPSATGSATSSAGHTSATDSSVSQVSTVESSTSQPPSSGQTHSLGGDESSTPRMGWRAYAGIGGGVAGLAGTILASIWIARRRRNGGNGDSEESTKSTSTEMAEPFAGGRVEVDVRLDPRDVVFAETEKLGSGGFGAVFAGTYTRKGRPRPVAIKHSPDTTPDGQRLTMKEVSTAMNLVHQYIVKFYGVVLKEEGCYVVMERCDFSLHDLLHGAHRRQLSCDQVYKMAFQIASGIEFLHSKGFLHRDIKPQNILFREGVAKVADFDAAKRLSDMQHLTRETLQPKADKPGMTKGGYTLAYAPPELIACDVDPRNVERTQEIDVYEFGMVLYEIVTGQQPFADVTGPNYNQEICQRITDGHLPQLPEYCPAPLATIIMQCTQHNPDERPTMARVRETLEWIIQNDYQVPEADVISHLQHVTSTITCANGAY